jgi:hypothetical protein
MMAENKILSVQEPSRVNLISLKLNKGYLCRQIIKRATPIKTREGTATFSMVNGILKARRKNISRVKKAVPRPKDQARRSRGGLFNSPLRSRATTP